MPDILHRLTIDAPPAAVEPLVATRAGVERWWTGRAVEGDDALGGRFAIFFGAYDEPSAVLEVVERAPERVVWRVAEGPADWVDTRVAFDLSPRADGGTTLLFSHAGWREQTEFMHGCSTNWAAYLMSLKAGAEGRGFGPYPAGEVSRWS